MNSNTPAPKLSNDVINQIKDLPKYRYQSSEQNSLIDELIPNEELRERYKKYGLCKECSQLNTYRYYNWCQSCNSKHFHTFIALNSFYYLLPKFCENTPSFV